MFSIMFSAGYAYEQILLSQLLVIYTYTSAYIFYVTMKQTIMVILFCMFSRVTNKMHIIARFNNKRLKRTCYGTV